jgi:hypothetical protein
MSANKFVMKHHQVEVDYTIGATAGVTALVYQDGAGRRVFTVNEVTTEKTALGSLVSVSLTSPPTEPGCPNERFGFFLPDLDVTPGQTERFSTAGVSVQSTTGTHVPYSSYRCFELHGAAQLVPVPLKQPATL